MIKSFISKIQNKPYETRIKILWGGVVVAFIILLLLMVQNIKSSISGAGTNLVQIEAPNELVNDMNSSYASVERVEQDSKSLKIYFNINNTTEDILNIPQISDITLKTDGNTKPAQKITDRQGNNFVKKVLSHTQVFGILVFPVTTETDAILTFNRMFLEQNPSSMFRSSLELNLEELNKPSNVRK